ncbi:hypothetical protein [Enterobacter hormaechei]|uniref:hypothetical protein n=1 Tax=Enterobacter hormaechei TaxID=158836 RepID=UPI003DCB293E
MTQKTLAERFDELELEYQEVTSTKYTDFNDILEVNKEYVDSSKYKTWIARVKKLISDCYGKDSDFYKDFIKAEKGFYASNHDILTKQLKPAFDAAKADVAYSVLVNEKAGAYDDKLELIINILNKFPAFYRQLKKGMMEGQQLKLMMNMTYRI